MADIPPYSSHEVGHTGRLNREVNPMQTMTPQAVLALVTLVNLIVAMPLVLWFSAAPRAPKRISYRGRYRARRI